MPTTDSTAESPKQIHYLTAALKTPRITDAAAWLADPALRSRNGDSLPSIRTTSGGNGD